MKYTSAHIIHSPPTIHPTELLLPLALGSVVPEENDHFLDYFSLAFAVIVTKQENTSFDLPNNDTYDGL